jgi:2-dehydro-3-deoxyphosphooctonate aldolase (KDO 8-P synthase)
MGVPVVFDATHSVQLPGGKVNVSGGDRRFAAPLSRAAASVGIDGLFLEVHESPEDALCDGPNSIRLSDLRMLLAQVVDISKNIKGLN